MNPFFDAQDEEGYTGPTMGGFAAPQMGDLSDDITALANATNPAVVFGIIPPFGDPGTLDPSNPNSVTPANVQKVIAQMTPASGFPSWAGSPSIFMGRIANLNTATGSNFAINTSPVDPSLMAAVRQFQGTHGLTADGEMGPKTGATLQALVSGGVPASPTAPLAVTPVSPSSPAAPSGVLQNASATDKATDHTKLFVALGVGGVALLALAYFATAD